MATNNSLTEAMQASADATTASGAQKNVLERVLKDMGLLTQSSIGSIDAAAAGTNVVEGQLLEGQQRAQDDARTYANSLGALGTNPEALLVRLGVDLNTHLEASKVARDTIVAKQSLNPFNDPVGWFTGQMTIEADQSRYDVAQGAVAGISKDITTVTQTVDAFGRTQAALALKVTDASRAAAAEVNLQLATKLKNEATAGLLKSEVEVTNAIQNATAEQAQQAQARHGMLVNQEQLEMQRAQFAMAKQSHAASMKDRAAAAKDKTSKDAINADQLAIYNAGAKVTGNQTESNWELVLARAASSQTAKDRISAIFDSGFNTIASGQTKLSATPGGAAYMVTKGVLPVATAPGFAPMDKLLKEKWVAALTLNKGNEANTVVAVNASLKIDAETYAKNATATGSFYAAPAFESILATEAVKNSALVRKVPAITGLKTADPDAIWKLAYEAARAGVITLDQASFGVKTIFSKAVEINNAERKFTQIGIPGQVSFNTPIDYVGAGGKPINLLDQNAIIHSFVRRRAYGQSLTNADAMKLPFSYKQVQD